MSKEFKDIERIDGEAIESNLIERQLGFESYTHHELGEEYKLKYKTKKGDVIAFTPEGSEASFHKVNLTKVEDSNDAATKKYVDDLVEESNITTVRPHLTGFVTPDEVAVTYDTTSRIVTLKPKDGIAETKYYVNGELFSLAAGVTATLDNSVVGHFYAFLNKNGIIEFSQEWKTNLLPLISAYRVSNNLGEAHTTAGDINNEYLSLVHEYHGTTMDGATREYLHCNVGAWVEAGCSVTIAENQATFSRSEGIVVKGDIATTIAANATVSPAVGYMTDVAADKFTIEPSSTNWLTENGSGQYGACYQGATKKERAPQNEGAWYLYFVRPDMREGKWCDIIVPLEGHSSFNDRYKGLDAKVRSIASKYIDFIGDWKVLGLLFLQGDSIGDHVDLTAYQIKDLLYCGMLEKMLTTIEDNQNLSDVLTQGNDAGGKDIVGVGKVGIGTDSPEEKLDVDNGNIVVDDGRYIKSRGSGNLILGNNTGGNIKLSGDGSISKIRANFNHLDIGTDRNSSHLIMSTGDNEAERMRIEGDTGNIGIGTKDPKTKLHVSEFDLGSDWLGTPSQLSLTATDAQIDLVSTQSAHWGSGIQLKQVNDASLDYNDVWGIRRQTTAGGTGDGSLNLTYGTDQNAYVNPKIAKFHTDGTAELPSASGDEIEARGPKAITTKEYVESVVDNMLDVDGSNIVQIVKTGEGTSDTWYKIGEFTKTQGYGNFNATWEILGRDITPFELNLKIQGNASSYLNPQLRISCKYSNPSLYGLEFKLVSSDESGTLFTLFVRRKGTNWHDACRIIKQCHIYGYKATYMLDDAGTTEPTGHQVLTASIDESFEVLPESQDLSDVLSKGNDAGGQDINNAKSYKSSDVTFQGLTAGGSKFSAQILGGEWNSATNKYISTQTTYRPVLIQTASSGLVSTFAAKNVPSSVGEAISWDETSKVDNSGNLSLPQSSVEKINSVGAKAVTTKEYVDSKVGNTANKISSTSLQKNQEYFIAFAKGGPATGDYQVYSGEFDISFSVETASFHNEVRMEVSKLLNKFIAKVTNQCWTNANQCLDKIKIYNSTTWYHGMVISITPKVDCVIEGVFTTSKENLWYGITPTTVFPSEALTATNLAMDMTPRSGYTVFNSIGAEEKNNKTDVAHRLDRFGNIRKNNLNWIEDGNSGLIEVSPTCALADIDNGRAHYINNAYKAIDGNWYLRKNGVGQAIVLEGNTQGITFYQTQNGAAGDLCTWKNVATFEHNGSLRLPDCTSTEISVGDAKTVTTKEYVDNKVANITETQGLSDVLSKGNSAGGQDINNVGRLAVGDNITAVSSGWHGPIVSGANGTSKVIMGHLKSITNKATIGAHNSDCTAWADLVIGGTNIEFVSAEGQQLGKFFNNGILTLPNATKEEIGNSTNKVAITKEWAEDNFLAKSITDDINNVIIQEDGPHNLVAGNWYYITWTQGNNPCNLKAYYEFVGPGIGVNMDLHLLVRSSPTGTLTYSGNYSPIDKIEVLTQGQDYGHTWCVRVYCSRDCTLNARYQMPFESKKPGENFYPKFYKGCSTTNPVASADKSYFYEYVKTYAGYTGAKSRTRLIHQKAAANIDVKINESDRGNISFRGSASSLDDDAILNFTSYGGANTRTRISLSQRTFNGSVTSESPFLSTSLLTPGQSFELDLGYFSTMTGDISWQKIGTEYYVNGRVQVTTIQGQGYTNVQELVLTCNSSDISNLTLRAKDHNAFDHVNFDVEEY